MRGRRDSILLRIWQRTVLIPGPLPTPCRIWQGPTSGSNGRGKNYARMCLSGQTVAVHRVVYTHFFGYIPGRKQIDHKCNNRLCVAEDHLQMVTHRRNQKLRDKRKAA